MFRKNINKLIIQNDFELKTKKKEEILIKYLNYIHNDLRKTNKIYSKITNNFFRSKYKKINDFPFIPVQYFKKNNLDLSRNKFDKRISSSSTSGNPSIIGIDKQNSRIQILSIFSTMQSFLGKKRRNMYICDKQIFDNKLISARSAAANGFSNYSKKKIYLLDKNENLNISNLKLLFKEKEPCFIFGFTFLIYEKFLKKLSQKRIKLPSNSYLIHLGGWKKLEESKVSSEKFKELIFKSLSINKKNIIDIYGFTEQMGTLYPECKFGYKHTPDFAHVICRDPYSLKVLNNKNLGVGQFISLVNTSYAGFSLLTDDLIKIFGDDNCKCGRKGRYFKVLGRAANAEIRGCGDVLGSRIFSIDKKFKTNSDKIDLLFFQHSFQKRKIDNVKNIKKFLDKKRELLSKISVHDIIEIIKLCAKEWKKNKYFNDEGTNFLCNWILTDKFEKDISFSLNNNLNYLDQFIKLVDENKKITANPRGLVVHWIAGNVPTLGLISFLISLVCKNSNIIKLPKGSNELFLNLFKCFLKLSYKNVKGDIIKGSDIVSSTCIIQLDKESKLQIEISKISDVRIAWGGKEAIESISNLPKKINTQDIIFGPKISLAMIDKSSINLENNKLDNILFKLTKDICLFDQKACASVHNIYIENTSKKIKEIIEKKLSFFLEKYSNENIMENNDFKTLDNIKNARLDAILNNASLLHNYSLQWTIIADNNLKNNKPAYGKTVYLHYIKNLEEVLKILDDKNQVVGLEAQGSKRINLAKKITERGVSRVTRFGEMTKFNLPWDDEFPTNKLVRWNYLD